VCEKARANDSGRRKLPVGKVPPDVLVRLLAQCVSPGSSEVVTGPAWGEDAAAVRVEGARMLAAAMDPITFPTPRPGWYAVHVNANDLAVSGARPLFFLLTFLFPPDTAESTVMESVRQAKEAADSIGARIIGGHTEITEAVDSIVVVGAAFGPVIGAAPIRTGGARAGDALLQVDPMAIEGTTILAEEHRDALVERLGREILDRAASFIDDPGISVVRPALFAAENFIVHAMHDPTEGGIATGIAELAGASDLGVEVWEKRLMIAPETRAVCAALGYDPLGLISSGCVLMAVPSDKCEDYVNALRHAGFSAAHIGQLLPSGEGMHLVRSNGERVELPRFEVDQLASGPTTPNSDLR